MHGNYGKGRRADLRCNCETMSAFGLTADAFREIENRPLVTRLGLYRVACSWGRRLWRHLSQAIVPSTLGPSGRLAILQTRPPSSLEDRLMVDAVAPDPGVLRLSSLFCTTPPIGYELHRLPGNGRVAFVIVALLWRNWPTLHPSIPRKKCTIKTTDQTPRVVLHPVVVYWRAPQVLHTATLRADVVWAGR